MIRTYSRLLIFGLPLLLVLLPAPTRALGPGFDVYLGYSRLGANTFYPNTAGLNGWQATGHIHLLPFLGTEADVARYGLGSASNIPHTTTVMAGPRVTVGAAGIHVFAHGLAGWEHSTSGLPLNISSGALAVAAGGGVDFRIAPFFSWRVSADYIEAPTRSNTGGHNRFGTGLVFRF